MSSNMEKGVVNIHFFVCVCGAHFHYFLVYKIVECVLACVYVVSPQRLRKFVKSFHCMLNQKMTTVIKLNIY